MGLNFFVLTRIDNTAPTAFLHIYRVFTDFHFEIVFFSLCQIGEPNSQILAPRVSKVLTAPSAFGAVAQSRYLDHRLKEAILWHHELPNVLIKRSLRLTNPEPTSPPKFYGQNAKPKL